MSDDETSLTPEQARARFGDLLHGPTRTYMFFEGDEGGTWVPRLDMDKSLLGYRLHRPAGKSKGKPVWRPKVK